MQAGEIGTLNVGAFDGRLLFLADTKTDEPRIVPLRQSAAEGVQAYLDWRRAGKGRARKGGCCRITRAEGVSGWAIWQDCPICTRISFTTPMGQSCCCTIAVFYRAVGEVVE